jgi:DNA-binding response OmpR family regulator
METAIARALQRRRERLRQRHLIGVIARAAEALRTEEEPFAPLSSDTSQRILSEGCISLDLDTRVVAVAAQQEADRREIELTTSEAALLVYLMQHAGTVQSCRDLARNALGYQVTEREAQQIVRPHISRLRGKVESDPTHPHIICTILGKGYRLVPH